MRQIVSSYRRFPGGMAVIKDQKHQHYRSQVRAYPGHIPESAEQESSLQQKERGPGQKSSQHHHRKQPPFWAGRRSLTSIFVQVYGGWNPLDCLICFYIHDQPASGRNILVEYSSSHYLLSRQSYRRAD